MMIFDHILVSIREQDNLSLSSVLLWYLSLYFYP